MRKLKNIELNRLSVDEFKQVPKLSLVLVLDNIRSMHNVGAMFRTADAFALKQLYLCGITATPPNREIYKTALGAEDAVNWTYHEHTRDALAQLKADGYQVWALEQTTGSLALNTIAPVNAEEKIALVVGNEVNGVDEELLPHIDKAIEIPQWGTKHSLNVAVSAGIALWQIIPKP